MRFVLVLVLLAAGGLAGCGQPSGPPEPLDVRIVHLYDQPHEPDHFVVPRDSEPADLMVKLANYYRGRCPLPLGSLTLKDPDGAVVVRLESQNRPVMDCEYVHYENATTLKAGKWRIEYSGGSEYLGSLVTVRTNATAAGESAPRAD